MKIGVANRVVAKGVDALIVFLLAVVFIYPLGPICGFLYSIFADGFHFGPFHGQSVGKRLLHLQVRNTVHRRPGGWMDSATRNAPVGVATFFGIIPIWGWLVLILVGIPLMIMEVYLMVTIESGHRLGDVMADTEVVEAKK